MKVLILLFILFFSLNTWSQAKVMNPGEAYGQLVYLSVADVMSESEKYKSLTPYSIPVFAELPMELAVVAGTITLKQQNLLSHVQLKSRARRTPNLDISELEGGLDSPLFAGLKDGDWIHLKLSKGSLIGNEILIEPSTQAQAIAYAEQRTSEQINLEYDLSRKAIVLHSASGWQDYNIVGSKAANYAELLNYLNSERDVVRHGFSIPFYYYQEFIDSNPIVKNMILDTIYDPLMYELADITYRRNSLQALQAAIMSPESKVSDKLIDELLTLLDQWRDEHGLPLKMKLRSSTNAEDLPDFNGAGLYTSKSYKPYSKGIELSREEKIGRLTDALKTVWASVWNLRAFEERNYFNIPHDDVKMGIQINPSFSNELVDGVVVTKNIAAAPSLSGKGVYIEAQRGDNHSVANPQPKVKPQKILVLYSAKEPLDRTKYQVYILQNSNIADDMITILPEDNLNPVLMESEAKELVYLSLKAEKHFHGLLDPKNDNFALDLEFKVDKDLEDNRQVYLKQARPYLD